MNQSTPIPRSHQEPVGKEREVGRSPWRRKQAEQAGEIPLGELFGKEQRIVKTQESRALDSEAEKIRRR